MELLEYQMRASVLLKTAEQIETAKRPAYVSGNSDVHHNFKSVAARVGVTPGQVLAVYLLKHLDAVVASLCQPELPQAEAIETRYADAINYLKLGYALKTEGQYQGSTAPLPALMDLPPASPPPPKWSDPAQIGVPAVRIPDAPEIGPARVLGPTNPHLGVIRGWRDRGIEGRDESAPNAVPDLPDF